jgi:molybdate-binding protein
LRGKLDKAEMSLTILSHIQESLEEFDFVILSKEEYDFVTRYIMEQ